MSGAFWLVNIFLEMAPPAVSIASAASSVIQPGYRPLANPSFLIYFLLLMLTILRLDPPLSVLCGFLAAGSYLAAAYHLGWRPWQSNTDHSLYSPQKNVITYAISLIVVGVTPPPVPPQFPPQVKPPLPEPETP